MVLREWIRRGRSLKRETYALFLACRDPRTPWLARMLGVAIVAYALSPIDLIPDFIPVLGLLDDLILLPLGLAVVLRMIPHQVMEESRARADVVTLKSSRAVTIAVVAFWVLALALVAFVAAKALGLLGGGQ
jgi:uncharacterized membrane protein YkvA (DUF1232 family)